MDKFMNDNTTDIDEIDGQWSSDWNSYEDDIELTGDDFN